MWLDRFAPQPTPSATPPQGRSFSPAPRRPYLHPDTQPHRPGLTPRSSSLSLASGLTSPNASSANLPPNARVPNGSSLKYELQQAPPSDITDPLHVLHNIIGAPPRKTRRRSAQTTAQLAEKPAELVEDIDFGELDLEAFADVQDNIVRQPSNIHTYSVQSSQEYDLEKDKFEDLHRSIIACDEVLKSVELYLTNFQADLGAVSAEIETLQSRSTALNTKLENRRVVEKLLGPAVEDISLSPALVRKIAEGAIDEGWVRALKELEKRTKVIETKSEEAVKIKAVDDLKPLLTDLTNKAVERIRDHIVTQIKALRSPNINAQIIQQQSFVKYKDLYAFLARHQPKLSEEISQAYVNTMRWYYLNHFSRYQKALEKIKLHMIDKTEVIGNQDDTSRRGSKVASAPHDPFSLGRRLDPLKSRSPTALSSYLVDEDKSTYYLEVPFRSFNIAVIDNASYEYTFLTTFFSPTQSYHAISRLFASIFEPTFALGQAFTKQLIDSTVDALGVLLAVRLNQHFAFELQRRKVPAVDGYTNATNMLLWPRFQILLDLHCESLRRATAALPGRPAASTILTSSSSAAAQSTAPHQLAQRFASLLQGILAMSSEAGDDEPVSNSLGRLRGEFEAFLVKLSKGVADKRKRQRFLANNWSLVGTVLEGCEGRLADEARAHFEGLKEAAAGDD
ncbi:Sac2 family protein [Aulographum hederae CBS 113979]|uniref:Sac2 family protein n=1 Tax=Aulographum hederae CBS 113979 TaxID=1176131 RepID=A0A6G1HH06_9PEZI|nr:Sac2 family protein [Aulographum hederae CBS 113979]